MVQQWLICGLTSAQFVERLSSLVTVTFEHMLRVDFKKTKISMKADLTMKLQH